MRPLGGLPPAGQPSPPSRAHAYSAGEGRVVHSTARGGAIEHIGGAGADAPTGADGLLLCSVALPLATLRHRRAGSCARDSRLTHLPSRPAPRHRIRRREHASLSMSPVRARGGSWCPLSRALGAGSRAALAGAGARQLPAVPSGRRDGVAREQGRLVVAVARAGRGWGCGLLGTGAARLTTRADGQPARPARAVNAPRQSRPRGAGVAVEAARRPRRDAALATASPPSLPRVPAMRVRAPGHRWGASLARRGELGGGPRNGTRRAPASARAPAQDEEKGERGRAAVVALE